MRWADLGGLGSQSSPPIDLDEGKRKGQKAKEPIMIN